MNYDSAPFDVRNISLKESLKCHHTNCNDKEFHPLEAYNNHCQVNIKNNQCIQNYLRLK
jgi:hypothetical protein